MEITGKILAIGATEQVSEKFKKRQLVIEYAENPSYPETIAFELTQDKASLADKFKVGQTVEVGFNLRGRAYEKGGKTSYFNTLNAWTIRQAEGMPAYATAGEVDEENQDLPF